MAEDIVNKDELDSFKAFDFSDQTITDRTVEFGIFNLIGASQKNDIEFYFKKTNGDQIYFPQYLSVLPIRFNYTSSIVHYDLKINQVYIKYKDLDGYSHRTKTTTAKDGYYFRSIMAFFCDADDKYDCVVAEVPIET